MSMDAAAIKQLLVSTDISVLQQSIESYAQAESQYAAEAAVSSSSSSSSSTNSLHRNRVQQEQLVKLQIMLWSRVLALQQQQQHKESDNDMNNNTDLCRTYCSIGQLWMRMGDSEKAVGQFQKALLTVSNDRHNVSTLELLSHALVNLAEYEKAIEHQERAITILEEDSDNNNNNDTRIVMAYTQLANIYEAKGDFGQAVSILKKNIERIEQQSNNANTVDQSVAVEVYSRLGVIQTKLGESKEAVAPLHKAHQYYVQTKGAQDPKTQEMAFLLDMALSS